MSTQFLGYPVLGKLRVYNIFHYAFVKEKTHDPSQHTSKYGDQTVPKNLANAIPQDCLDMAQEVHAKIVGEHLWPTKGIVAPSPLFEVGSATSDHGVPLCLPNYRNDDRLLLDSITLPSWDSDHSYQVVLHLLIFMGHLTKVTTIGEISLTQHEG